MDAERVSGRKPGVRVAFIAGTSWSGSTLLEQALAQIDGCFSVGELYWLWNPHWPEMVCECGREFRACEFWPAVLDEAYGSHSESVRADIAARGAGLLHHSILPTMARARSRLNPTAALRELGSMVEPTYRAVRSVSGASTVIDASKCGLWGLAISKVEVIDLRVVHLVRHPMGFVSSDGRTREVPYPPGATRPPRPANRSLITWLLLNVEAEYLSRQVQDGVCVLYEDLVLSPAVVARQVARFLDTTSEFADLFVDDSLVVRRTGHAIGGNPRRPKIGQTAIVRTEASPRTVTRSGELLRRALAQPLWSRYQRSAHTRTTPSTVIGPERVNGAPTRSVSLEPRGHVPSA